MVTKRQYIEYLINTPSNYTCSNLADHLEGVSHDAVSDFLQRDKLTARLLWELARPLIKDSANSFLIVDDSVQDKRYSKNIELVKLQYSGNAHGLVRGIGIVNLVHSDGSDFYPTDYRIYAPDCDDKTKNDHFGDMLIRAKSERGIKANTIVFDAWYGSVANLKLVHRLGMTFVTTIKSNRMVSVSKEQGYIHLDQLEWSEEQLAHGQRVKLKEVPFKVQLFKLVAINGDIEWAITNRLDDVDVHFVQDGLKVRWQIEQLHRELKQLIGTENCQCRKQRSQRNHLACCYQAWLSIKVKALQLAKSSYAVVADLWRDYLRAELRHPRIPALVC
ncbi:MAG TPA: transposase [Chloroflexia bacterium]|nr:transposase [Chloroflexia bacterium]